MVSWLRSQSISFILVDNTKKGNILKTKANQPTHDKHENHSVKKSAASYHGMESKLPQGEISQESFGEGAGKSTACKLSDGAHSEGLVNETRKQALLAVPTQSGTLPLRSIQPKRWNVLVTIGSTWMLCNPKQRRDMHSRERTWSNGLLTRYVNRH